MEEVGTTIEVHELTGVIPGHNAESELEEPAGSKFEGAADDGGHAEDEQGVLVPEAIQGDGHEQGAHAVDGAEGSPEHASAIFDASVQEGADGAFDEKAQDAADDEDPEDVEEVQADVAFAGSVAA